MADTTSPKAKLSKPDSTAGSSTGSSKKQRRKTGAHQRQSQRRMGHVTLFKAVDPVGPEEAKRMFLEEARNSLATGMTLRVSAQADVDAAPPIIVTCRSEPQRFAERLLPPVFVDGAALVAHDLQLLLGPVPSLAPAAKGKGKAGAGTEAELGDPTAYAEAYNFATKRRKAIARLAKGASNRQVRREFGVHLALSRKTPSSIVRAINALIAGRNSPRSGVLGRRYLTDADAKKAAALVKRVVAAHAEEVSARKAERRRNRKVAILHAALELFYDRYEAAAQAVFEDDEAAMIDALALIPRRALHHPAPPDESSTEGQTSNAGQTADGGQAAGANGQGGTPAASATPAAAPVQ